MNLLNALRAKPRVPFPPNIRLAVWRVYEVYDREGKLVLLNQRFNDLSIKGAGDGLCWDDSPGAGAPYTVFCAEDGGKIGFIGMSTSTGFLNDNIAPDLGARP